MNSMRIKVALYLPLGKKSVQWSGLGGAEKRLSYLISHMNSELYEISIVFRVYQGKDQVENLLSNYIAETCSIIFVKSNYEAFRHFRKEKYNYVLYDDFMVSTIPGALGAFLGGSQRILIFVTEYYARWSFKKKWHSNIMKFNGVLSTRIDCLYPSSVATLKKHFPRKEITATPCSLPMLDVYLNYSKNVTKENIIAFVSRLVDDKNPMMLLEAVNSIADSLRIKGYTVVICGDGPLTSKIKDYINNNSLSDVVFFMGKQNTMDIFPKTKCFCSLQENENYPSQSLLEAIASGCLCIATNVGDTKSIVLPEFGFLIEANCSSLAHELLHVMDIKPDKTAEMSKKAQEFALNRFNPHWAILHYESICGKES